MGVSYLKPISQWSKGEYLGANNREDDIALIRKHLPLIPPDAGSSAATATRLNVTVVSESTSTALTRGVIESSTNVDWYAFTAGAGAMNAGVGVVPKNGGMRANLDALLTLYDTSGSRVLATSNPSTCASSSDCTGATQESLEANLKFNLTAEGTYFLTVRGTGAGNAGTSGYSAYGSLGQYSLTASFPTATAGGSNNGGLNETTGNTADGGGNTTTNPPLRPTGKVVAIKVSSLVKGGNDRTRRFATATLQVTDVTLGSAPPARVGRATVIGRWDFAGSTNSSTSVRVMTSPSGSVTNRSPQVRSAGRLTFTVTNVTGTGLNWDRVPVSQIIVV